MYRTRGQRRLERRRFQQAAEKVQLADSSEYDSGVLAEREARMHGSDERGGDVFSLFTLEDCVPLL
jgi:hypothetical protein